MARKAESKFDQVKTSVLELSELADSRKVYEDARTEYSEFLPEEKQELNQEISDVLAIEDDEINEELYSKAKQYKENRDSVLAMEAARRHDEDINITEMIDPDRETYRQTLQYIKNVDDQIFNEYIDGT